jgi:hypothetical protein
MVKFINFYKAELEDYRLNLASGETDVDAVEKKKVIPKKHTEPTEQKKNPESLEEGDLQFNDQEEEEEEEVKRKFEKKIKFVSFFQNIKKINKRKWRKKQTKKGSLAIKLTPSTYSTRKMRKIKIREIKYKMHSLSMPR